KESRCAAMPALLPLLGYGVPGICPAPNLSVRDATPSSTMTERSSRGTMPGTSERSVRVMTDFLNHCSVAGFAEEEVTEPRVMKTARVMKRGIISPGLLRGQVQAGFQRRF